MKLRKLNIFLLFVFYILLTACGKNSNLPWEYKIHTLNEEANISIQKVKSTQQGLFAIGGNRFESGNIFHFDGNDWTEIALPPHRNKAFYSLEEQTSSGQLTLVGYDGNILIKETTSSPWSFYDQPYWEWMQDVAITDNGTWIVAGEAFHNGKLFHLNNMGEMNLKDTFEFELSCIDFSQYPQGYILGYGTVLETLNAGETWHELTLQGDHFKDYYQSANEMYIIGYEGSIWRKSSTAQDWVKLRKQNTLSNHKTRLRSIHMMNDIEGFIVADKGLILYTKDRWENMRTFKVPGFEQADFLTITAKDATTLWIGCSNGKIIEIYL